MSIVDNERTKLLASALNSAATSCFTVGIIAPEAAAFYGASSPSVTAETIILGVVVWICAALALHLAARHVLGGLVDDE